MTSHGKHFFQNLFDKILISSDIMMEFYPTFWMQMLLPGDAWVEAELVDALVTSFHVSVWCQIFSKTSIWDVWIWRSLARLHWILIVFWPLIGWVVSAHSQTKVLLGFSSNLVVQFIMDLPLPDNTLVMLCWIPALDFLLNLRLEGYCHFPHLPICLYGLASPHDNSGNIF